MKKQYQSLILILLGLAGCIPGSQGVPKKDATEPAPLPSPSPSPKPIVVEKWVLPQYDPCELKLLGSLTGIPFGLVVSVQRSDLNRYDALNSHRPWSISPSLELKEFGTPLIDSGKEGQFYFSLANTGIDENVAYLNKTWEDPDHAMAEIAYEGISMDDRAYRSDVFRVDLDNNSYKNLTTDSPSYYNAGAFPYLNGILFTAILEGIGRTFSVQNDGSQIKPFIQTPGYAYGITVSPDGTKYAFHSDYKVYIGDMETKVETQVQSPNVFNFGPKWSADSQWIVFKSGPDNERPDLWTAKRDGSNIHLLNSFGGYSSAVPFMDGYDFHHGGSDRITVSAEGAIHGKKIGSSVEIVLSRFEGTSVQLTNTINTQNTYPEVSQDGKWLLFNSKKGSGPMNLMLLNLVNQTTVQLTDMAQHCNTRMAYWIKLPSAISSAF